MRTPANFFAPSRLVTCEKQKGRTQLQSREACGCQSDDPGEETDDPRMKRTDVTVGHVTAYQSERGLVLERHCRVAFFQAQRALRLADSLLAIPSGRAEVERARLWNLGRTRNDHQLTDSGVMARARHPLPRTQTASSHGCAGSDGRPSEEDATTTAPVRGGARSDWRVVPSARRPKMSRSWDQPI